MSKYYSDDPLCFASAEPGDRLALLVKQPNEVDVVRFCAAIRNFHRYHYDREFTKGQGIEDIIVPGFLMGNWCLEAVTRSFEPATEITGLKFRNTATAPICEDYEILGEIADVDESGPRTIRCSLAVKRRTTGDTVTTATVSVRQSTQSNSASAEAV